MAQVQLEKLAKVYPGGVRAVDGIDLSIADREFVVLVGPSGCGKSTTLRMIAGLEEISGGTIRIGERVVNEVPPKDRDIAMVFQNYALYPHMTVRENMGFALKLRKVPKAEIKTRVDEAGRILDIGHLMERKPKELSGGQRQRVAVGRAIVREPAAFLFDEPLSNLDAKLRVTTRAELKRLHQRLRTTTVYVTHDQEEAMTLGDRIVVMKDGRIHQADTPLNCYLRPVDRFVAGFIGMPPMNFFEGVVRETAGRLVFEEGGVEGGFRVPAPERLRERLGQQVVVGIRPEHFQMTPVAGDGGYSVEATVLVVEPLGRDMDVYLKTMASEHVVARVEARADLGAGERVRLFADGGKVHFFEVGDAGRNLARSDPLAR
jgi:multiple sugar transport system ATP-binding protein